jgi:hypothetical protein
MIVLLTESSTFVFIDSKYLCKQISDVSRECIVQQVLKGVNIAKLILCGADILRYTCNSVLL